MFQQITFSYYSLCTRTYDFHCEMCNNNTFSSFLMQRFEGKHDFIVLSSLETVHGTVQYRYCIFSLLYRLLRIRLKRQNPLFSYERKREKEHCKCAMYCVQYTLLLLYLMLVIF